jgi:hypothetical protein
MGGETLLKKSGGMMGNDEFEFLGVNMRFSRNQQSQPQQGQQGQA